MMSIHVTPEHGRIARRVSLAAAVAGLLLAGSLWTPAALAQNDGGQPAKTTSDSTQKPADNTQKPSDKLSLGTQDIDPSKPIQPGYVLSVNIAGETDASGNYPVDPAGNINIHYAGMTLPVAVKGKTLDQAHNAVAEVLKKYIKKPDVSVSIVAVPHPTVFLSGALRVTGEAQIRPDTTLVDLLSRAEWLDNADLTQVRLIRPAQNAQSKPDIQTLDVEKYTKPAADKPLDPSLNPTLHDKDRIFVPFKSVSGTGTVSVTGDVAKPSPSIPYRSTPPLTVSEAVNLAGGANATANKEIVTVRRPGVDKPLIVNLQKAEQGDLVENIELKPDDDIYVTPLQENKFVNVAGGVFKPGKIVFDKPMMLTEAVMAAGGVTATAKTKSDSIFRGADTGNTKVITFNWEDIQKGKAKDIALQPGDNIFIGPGTTTHTPSALEQILPILRDGALFFSVLRR
ncbi:MAG TPA: polysaccharide biosynthesis/export family protein [Chthonomonadaceae bacterium]|nr:polysaccharide biosynthesis/export family protein [Chthonomonadaceae bacterium]